MIKNVYWSSRTRYCCQILMKIEFLNSLSRNTQLAIFMKLFTVEAELFHADRLKDGRTDMTQLTVISQFCERA